MYQLNMIVHTVFVRKLFPTKLTIEVKNFEMIPIVDRKSCHLNISIRTKSTLVEVVCVDIYMRKELAWSTKRRMAIFPGTSVFFRCVAFVSISMKTFSMFCKNIRVMSYILTVINQTRKILPLVHSFTVIEQAVVTRCNL